MEIKIAQIKITPQKGKLEENHLRLMKILSDIQGMNVDVVITPECFLDGYVCTEDYVGSDNIKDYAIEPFESEYVKKISDWARNNQAWVIFGCMRKDGDRCYNTALVISKAGEIIGWYDKVHCQTHDTKYNAGNSLPVFDSDFGKFGVMICADRRWPETVRTLALKGARIIFNPTYGFWDDLNLCMMRTRSFESEVFIVFTHPNQALITNPKARVICDVSSDVQEVAITQVNLDEVESVRFGPYAHLRDRRPEVYGV